MEPSTTIAAPLRALLSEAAALRQRGDVGAAEALEADAVRVVRASLTRSVAEVRA